jgi:hypothetical protein
VKDNLGDNREDGQLLLGGGEEPLSAHDARLSAHGGALSAHPDPLFAATTRPYGNGDFNGGGAGGGGSRGGRFPRMQR